jgi:CSLREA domain-containing protein
MIRLSGGRSLTRSNSRTFRVRRFLVACATAALTFVAVPAVAHAGITIPVTSTVDPGNGICNTTECTLREAIDLSNATAGKDTITFQIGTGVKEIVPRSQLPYISDPVIIDGTTQPGYAGTPLILLRGLQAGLYAFGLNIGAGDSTVRGLNISRFDYSAIVISGNGGNTIEGNYLGVDKTGTFDVGNGGGVAISDSPGNVVGGSTAAQRNVISGNDYGVTIGGANATQNIVAGNYIGTNAAGTAAVGNDYDGVFISSAGFGNDVHSNVISGNGGIGVEGYWFDPGGLGPTVVSNLIGTAADGSTPLGNGWTGVALNGADWSSVMNNTIAYNGGVGVGVVLGTSNRITANSIYSNYDGAPYGLGIDLQSDGLTVNDPLDSDGEPNLGNFLQNFPIVESAVGDAAGTTVRGTLSSAAATKYFLEFFASPACDLSGYGEGKTSLGHVYVTTNGSGIGTFSIRLPVATPVGHVITATATSWSDPFLPQSDTSEFSPCTRVANTRTTSISAQDYSFKPSQAVVTQGGTAQWNFAGPNSHNVTDTSGMGFFASPAKPAGSTFAKKFTAAGSYPYRSTGEPMTMTGSIRVSLNASPSSGTTATSFTVTWGSVPSGFVEDVQIKRPGSASFVAWQTGQTAASAPFVADAGPGIYSFRARLRKPAVAAQSGWSPAKTISVS